MDDNKGLWSLYNNPKSMGSSTSQGSNRKSQDIKQMDRDLSNMESKIRKLNALYDQGSNKQSGFLSSKQVTFAKNMLKEIEKEYQKHYDALDKMYEKHNSKREQLEKVARKRSEQYEKARGDSAMGDLTSDEEMLRRKLLRDEAIAKLDQYNEQVSHSMKGYEASMAKLDSVRSTAQSTWDNKIGSLHEKDSFSGAISDMASMATYSSGAVLSVGSLVGSVRSGYLKNKYNQWDASDLGQKLEDYEGNDESLRKQLRGVGKENQFNTSDTIQTARELSRGGVKDTEGLKADVQYAQQFGRAFSVDPNQLAQSGSTLKQMGAMQDGEMQRFANLIGNAVAKNGMQGREEEQIRSSMRLIEQATSQMTEVDFSQIQNISALQNLVAQADPMLKGDRGANMLSNMDSALKNNDPIIDILQGYGTDPMYTGSPEGRWQLMVDRSKGISDPDNLKKTLQGLDRTTASIPLQNMILSTHYGLDPLEVESLRESGAFDAIKNEQLINEDMQDIMDATGSEQLKEMYEKYNKSMTSMTRDNVISKENRRSRVATPFMYIGENVSAMYNSLPEPIQDMGLIAGGIMGSSMASKVFKTIGNGASKLKGNILNKHGGFGGGTPIKGGLSAVDDMVRGAVSSADDIGSGLLSSMDDVGSGVLKSAPSVLSSGAKFASKAVKAAPVVGGLLDAGGHMMEGEGVGKSLAKGGLSSLLALGAGALLAPVTGGMSLLPALATAGAVGLGSSWVADKAVDAVWKEDDATSSSKSVSNMDYKSALNNIESSSSQEGVRDRMSREKYGMSIEDLREKARDIDSDLNKVKGEYNININVGGSIEGMTSENQTEITSSVSSFFDKMMSGNSVGQPTVNLSTGWDRGL